MKQYFYLLLAIVLSLSLCSCGQNNNKTESDDIILVTVNGENILKSEIDPVFEEYKESNTSYNQIVEDTINEVLVIQQADKYNLSVSKADIDESVTLYKNTYPELYNELLTVYSEETVRNKLKDRLLYSAVRDYALENICCVDKQLIQEFKEFYNLAAQLDSYSDEQLKRSLNTELQNFAIKKWTQELRKQAKIVYTEFYNNLQT